MLYVYCLPFRRPCPEQDQLCTLLRGGLPPAIDHRVLAGSLDDFRLGRVHALQVTSRFYSPS